MAATGSGGAAALVLGVVGARGGVGASTLAAALAARGARRTASVLVDLDAAAPGLDLLVGLEDDPGVRWPDLAGAAGAIDGATGAPAVAVPPPPPWLIPPLAVKEAATSSGATAAFDELFRVKRPIR